jgi:hypothetical protein
MRKITAVPFPKAVERFGPYTTLSRKIRQKQNLRPGCVFSLKSLREKEGKTVRGTAAKGGLWIHRL